MAQLGARFHGMEEVIGSIPIRSTNYSLRIEAVPRASPFQSLERVLAATVTPWSASTAAIPKCDLSW